MKINNLYVLDSRSNLVYVKQKTVDKPRRKLLLKYRLIYFNGCPNYLPAVELLNNIGLEFELVCQNELKDSDPLKSYSSPTLLENERIVFGSSAIGGGCSMLLPSESELRELL